MNGNVFEGLGLYEQIGNALYAQISQRLNPKVKELPQFFDVIQKRRLIEAFGQINWEHYFTVNPIEPLNKGIKERIIERFESLNDAEMNQKMIDDGINDMNIWVSALWDFHLILSFYLNCTVSTYKHRHFQSILKYYNFIRSEIKKRNLLIPNGLNVNPLKTYWQNFEVERKRLLVIAKKDEEIASRLCPNCGAKGSDIISWSSLRYHCKICGKHYPKKNKA